MFVVYTFFMQKDEFINAIQIQYSASEANKIAAIVDEKYSLNTTEDNLLKDIIVRINHHEPIQYILNEAWFYDIPFYVNEHTLIPRPETEELVDIIIKENKHITGIKIMDIGTGSGCIPVTLGRKLPYNDIYALDNSRDALIVAKKNAKTYHININFIEFDFLTASVTDFPVFDIIVSNPPYIPVTEEKLMGENVTKFEPHNALFVPDNHPLVFYEKIREFSMYHLSKNGKIYLETHYLYASQVAELFDGLIFETQLLKDISGNQRFVVVKKSE